MRFCGVGAFVGTGSSTLHRSVLNKQDVTVWPGLAYQAPVGPNQSKTGVPKLPGWPSASLAAEFHLSSSPVRGVICSCRDRASAASRASIEAYRDPSNCQKTCTRASEAGECCRIHR